MKLRKLFTLISIVSTLFSCSGLSSIVEDCYTITKEEYVRFQEFLRNTSYTIYTSGYFYEKNEHFNIVSKIDFINQRSLEQYNDDDGNPIRILIKAIQLINDVSYYVEYSYDVDQGYWSKIKCKGNSIGLSKYFDPDEYDQMTYDEANKVYCRNSEIEKVTYTYINKMLVNSKGQLYCEVGERAGELYYISSNTYTDYGTTVIDLPDCK